MSILGTLFYGEEEVHDLSSANTKIESLVLVKTLPSDSSIWPLCVCKSTPPSLSPPARPIAFCIVTHPSQGTRMMNTKGIVGSISRVMVRDEYLARPAGESAAATPNPTVCREILTWWCRGCFCSKGAN